MSKFISDPENYLKMSKPFENSETATEALSKFYEEVSELRKKYVIRDMLIVIAGSVKQQDGEIGDFMATQTFGDQLHHHTLAAYAYGQTKAEHDQRIQKFLAGKK